MRAADGERFNCSSISDQVAKSVKAISRACDTHGVSLLGAALQLSILHPIVTSIIPRLRSPEKLIQIVKWWHMDIPTQQCQTGPRDIERSHH